MDRANVRLAFTIIAYCLKFFFMRTIITAGDIYVTACEAICQRIYSHKLRVGLFLDLHPDNPFKVSDYELK